MVPDQDQQPLSAKITSPIANPGTSGNTEGAMSGSRPATRAPATIAVIAPFLVTRLPQYKHINTSGQNALPSPDHA